MASTVTGTQITTPALTVSGTSSLAATTISGTTTFGSAPMSTPSGSAPVFGARAWCVFDGTLTGTNAPTAGGNVTSVTRNAAGDYTINFTTAMPDANYLIVGLSAAQAAGAVSAMTVEREYNTGNSTTSCRIVTKQAGTLTANTYIGVAVFR